MTSWNVETLKEYVDIRFDGQDRAFNSQIAAQDKAITKAEIATDKRLEGLNELRRIVNDTQALLMPREEAYARLQALADKIEVLTSRVNISEGNKSGMKDSWGYLAGAVGIAAAIISWIVR